MSDKPIEQVMRDIRDPNYGRIPVDHEQNERIVRKRREQAATEKAKATRPNDLVNMIDSCQLTAHKKDFRQPIDGLNGLHVLSVLVGDLYNKVEVLQAEVRKLRMDKEAKKQ